MAVLTIGSLGIPRVELFVKSGVQGTQSRLRQFYDTKLSNCIENAFQALALDERRTSFAPAIWEKPAGNITVCEFHLDNRNKLTFIRRSGKSGFLEYTATWVVE